MKSIYAPDFKARQYFPGVEVLQLDAGLSAEAFNELVNDDVIIPKHVDMAGRLVMARTARPLNDVITMQRSPESPREPWAPDHFWHTDRAYWGDNQFATLLYAQKLAGEIAGTEVLDTTLLLEAVERDMPGTTQMLGSATSVFSVAKYYAEILPVKGSGEAITKTLEAKGCTTLDEVASKEAEKYKAKRFPTLPVHPFRRAAAIMIDEARTVNVEGTELEAAEVQALIAKIIANYLALPHDELADRPYYANHAWEPGQLLVMPQIGAMHRASPSPNGELVRNTLRLFVH